MSADHYTDTLEQVRRMVDALQAARETIALDRIGLASCCTQPDGQVDANDAPALAAYDLVLECIDAALAPVTGSPAPLCELIRWRLTTDAERPDADTTVLLQIVGESGGTFDRVWWDGQQLQKVEPGGTVETGWWDGEQWCLCESGGPAVQADVRAWAEVWGPAL